MRRFIIGVCVVLGVGLVLLCALLTTTHVRHRKMSTAPPLTVEEVRLLAAADAMPAAERSPLPVEPEAAAPGADSPVLKRALAPEERQEFIGPPGFWLAWSDHARVRTHDEVATLLWAVGNPGAGEYYFYAAVAAENEADQDTAREYFREALRQSLGGYLREAAYAHLAWLEDDPRVAQELLEAACAGDTPDFLQSAVVLCEVTGSEALRDRYLLRLQACAPERAVRIESTLGQRRAGMPSSRFLFAFEGD